MVVVLLSAAVTATVMVVLPTVKGIDVDAVPDITVVPFMLMVAFGSVAVGVTVRLPVLLATKPVYALVPVANTGLRAPLLSARPLRLALAARATVKV